MLQLPAHPVTAAEVKAQERVDTSADLQPQECLGRPRLGGLFFGEILSCVDLTLDHTCPTSRATVSPFTR